jgi:hypothetical protein
MGCGGFIKNIFNLITPYKPEHRLHTSYWANILVVEVSASSTTESLAREQNGAHRSHLSSGIEIYAKIKTQLANT